MWLKQSFCNWTPQSFREKQKVTFEKKGKWGGPIFWGESSILSKNTHFIALYMKVLPERAGSECWAGVPQCARAKLPPLGGHVHVYVIVVCITL